MKKIIITIIFIVGLVGILAWLGAINMGNTDRSSTPSGPAVLAAAEKVFDFGTISMAAGPVKHEFAIKNTAENKSVITKIYTSCMCTEASLRTMEGISGPFGMPGHGSVPRVNKKLESGEEAVVEVVFDPAAHGPAGIGAVERAVYLENDSGAPLELIIKATVTP